MERAPGAEKCAASAALRFAGGIAPFLDAHRARLFNRLFNRRLFNRLFNLLHEERRVPQFLRPKNRAFYSGNRQLWSS